MAWPTNAYENSLSNRGGLSPPVPIGRRWPATIAGEREGAVNYTDLIITIGLLCAYGLAIATVIYTYNKVKAFHKAGRERLRRLERAGRL